MDKLMIMQLHTLNKTYNLKIYSRFNEENIKLYICANNYNGNNNI